MSPLVSISRRLRRRVDALDFEPPVAFVYNPLAYARAPHEAYLTSWGRGPKEVLLLGMNPGPFGMAQTGVPFGDVTLVREFLGIEAPVGRPAKEHVKRRIEGFACPRSEVSGTRLWGWVRDRFGTPEAFFDRFFVVNYCPLVFMAETGKNVTPDKLPKHERVALDAACDAALRATVDELSPTWVLGVGAFATRRAREAVGDRVRIGTVLHPSPASPRANRGWSQQAEAELTHLGIELPGALG
jgi:single-strand selective monofunctional uracil DNA glycosylase